MYSLEQVRGFVAVAEELHFGRAAARLGMTQPPLSRAVQKLERDVGALLLERGSRGVALTPAGTVFLDEARRLLALADSAADLARRVARGSRGTLRVGFTAASAYGVLPRLLDHLRHTLPDVGVDVFELTTREQVDAVAAHELDLGLARPPFDPAEFGHRLLRREALMVAVPTGHPLTTLDRPVRADDLRSEPVVMHSPARGRYFHDLVRGLVPIAEQQVVQSVGQVLTMVWLVSARQGLAFVPRSTRLLGIDGVTYLPLETRPRQPVELHLLWPRASANPALGLALKALETFDAHG